MRPALIVPLLLAVVLVAVCRLDLVTAQHNYIQYLARVPPSRQTRAQMRPRSPAVAVAPIAQQQTTVKQNRPATSTGPANISPRNDEQLARAVVNLALSVGQNAAEDNAPAEIFSPISIMGVLNMLLLASNGLTRTELLGALKLGDKIKINEFHRRAAAMIQNLLDPNARALDRLAWKAADCILRDEDDEEEEDLDEPITLRPKVLRIANAIFAQDSLALSGMYTKLASQLYGSQVQKVNFRDSSSAAAIANRWVREATNGKIAEIASSKFPPETTMIIASSLYFKADWMNEFTARATKAKPFFPEGTGRPSIMVDMMSLHDCLPYYFDKELDVRMIGLPYRDNATTMYVLMPQDSTRAKIRQLQRQLTATRLDSMIVKMARRTATVGLPRMQLTSETSLEKVFRRLGVKSLFSAQHSDLRQMIDQSARAKAGPLYVSHITHKVTLSVDEKGTEGAAVTATLIDRAGSAVIFVVNSPFLVYIRHDPTRLPLFYGPVFDPRG